MPSSPSDHLPAGAATARSLGLWSCATCHAVYRPTADQAALTCQRCGAMVRSRKAQSVARSWALLLAATALYVPANLLPVMTSASFLGTQDDTIMSGIVYLWEDGSWPLAALVFVASIVVPLAKLLVLSYLLVSVQQGSPAHPRRRTRLYRALEWVGRWSMLDIFVVTLLAALVQLGAVATVTPGPGAAAFGAVVVLTMLATRSFDARLLWEPFDPPQAPSP